MSEILQEAAAFLPLQPATFHILLALAEDDRHGYAIMQDVSDRTGGALKLSAGTLYRSIQRMLEQGLIVEPRRRPAPVDDDERRRYYRITPLGEAVARAEAERLANLVRMARARGLAPSESLMRGYRLLLHLLSQVVSPRVRRRDVPHLRAAARRILWRPVARGVVAADDCRADRQRRRGAWGHPATRSPVHATDAGTDAWLYRDSHSHRGAWGRRDDRRIFGHGLRLVSPAAVSRARPPGDALGDEAGI